MAYRVLNGMAPPYLNQLVPVSSLPGRRPLRLSFTLQLHIPQYRLLTAGRCLFPVAASIFCNTLPDDVQSVPSVYSFWRHAAKDIPVSPVISGHHSLNFRTTRSWTLQQLGCFSHAENSCWTLIDIDIYIKVAFLVICKIFAVQGDGSGPNGEYAYAYIVTDCQHKFDQNQLIEYVI